MDNDDLPVGRILGRREVLALLGSAGAATLFAACLPGDSEEASATATSAGTTTPTTTTDQTPTPTAWAPATEAAISVPTSTASMPACVVVPERTEGPYFVDGQLERSDIREGVEGVPLSLSVNVVEVSDGACAPLAGATVDVWHCDALGVYSGVTDAGFETTGEQFLRGYQVTDENGVVRFDTIYPGWYAGRAVHVHFKVRSEGTDGEAYEFTSQWFFDEAVSDDVFATEPYSSKGQRDTTNETDGIYGENGDVLLLATEGNPESGYTAAFAVGFDLSEASVGAADGGGAIGPGPGFRS